MICSASLVFQQKLKEFNYNKRIFMQFLPVLFFLFQLSLYIFAPVFEKKRKKYATIQGFKPGTISSS